jgi:YHS domain-containing protein
MIRSILIFIFILAVYYAVKIVVRSAISAYGKDERPGRLPGDEMVQDPECRTYVVRDRAVTRRIKGKLSFFCSEACARQHEEKNRA